MNYTFCSAACTSAEMTLSNLWHKEHLPKFSVFQRKHISKPIIKCVRTDATGKDIMRASCACTGPEVA
jgi:hypothetical protein